MKTDERCANCRHWERRNAEKAYLDDESPDAVAAYERWGFCDMASSDGDKPTQPSTLAYARDYESYKAELITREDFSCVQWENRPTNANVPPSGAA